MFQAVPGATLSPWTAVLPSGNVPPQPPLHPKKTSLPPRIFPPPPPACCPKGKILYLFLRSLSAGTAPTHAPRPRHEHAGCGHPPQNTSRKSGGNHGVGVGFGRPRGGGLS